MLTLVKEAMIKFKSILSLFEVICIFFEAVWAVANIGSCLKDNHQIKLSLSKSLIQTVEFFFNVKNHLLATLWKLMWQLTISFLCWVISLSRQLFWTIVSQFQAFQALFALIANSYSGNVSEVQLMVPITLLGRSKKRGGWVHSNWPDLKQFYCLRTENKFRVEKMETLSQFHPHFTCKSR